MFQTISNLLEAKNDSKTLTITYKDTNDTLYKMLDLIKTLSSQGHSFSITVDKKSFEFDGDGSDRIQEIVKK